MSTVNDARAAGERVEALLAEVLARCGPEACDVATELVTCLVRLYGAGLTALMRIAAGDPPMSARLIADPLVESLLIVHDLHPLDIAARIRRALRRLGPGAELVRVDDEGVAHIRLTSECRSRAADIERAVADMAPETAGVRLVRELTLLSTRPAEAR